LLGVGSEGDGGGEKKRQDSWERDLHGYINTC
jgi:hypothetical protein